MHNIVSFLYPFAEKSEAFPPEQARAPGTLGRPTSLYLLAGALSSRQKKAVIVSKL